MFCCHHQHAAYDATYIQDRRLLRFAAYSAFLISFLLVVCRFAAYYSSRSLAVDAAMGDALKDWLISTLNAFLVVRSLRPADSSFPFGYGKIEAVAAFLQAALLSVVGGWIAFSAVRGAAAHDHSVIYTTTALVSLIISIALGFILSFIQSSVAKKTRSMAFLADAAHYRSDVFMNMGVLCCFLISVKIAIIDVIVGLSMSVYLLLTAWKVGKTSLKTLLDMSLPASTVEDLENLVLAHGGHLVTLRTHGSGRGEFIALQVIPPARATLKTVFEKQALLEQKIHQKFPRSFVMISWVATSPDEGISLKETEGE